MGERPKTPEFLIGNTALQRQAQEKAAEDAKLAKEHADMVKETRANAKQATGTASYGHSESPSVKSLFSKVLRDVLTKWYGQVFLVQKRRIEISPTHMCLFPRNGRFPPKFGKQRIR